MIDSIYIKNFILIEELSLEFKDGFSAFTGETGAGKSIVMDAIGLLCGDRVSSAMIRTGTVQAIVEGSFKINSRQRDMLTEAGIEADNLIVTREFDIEGKNVCRINQRTVTLSFLKSVVGEFVDIHSQHDNQYLLNQKFHLSLLDSFCEIPYLLDELAKRYKTYTSIMKQLQNLEEVTFSDAQFEMLQYQIKEIEDANLVLEEDKDLEERIKLMTSYEKIYSRLSASLSLLDSDSGILTQLHESSHHLKQLSDIDEVESMSSDTETAYYLLVDIRERINDYLATCTMDEFELNRMNERVFVINKLKRKYGRSIGDIRDKLVKMQEEFDQIMHREEVINKMKSELKLAYANFETVALEIRAIRYEKAATLEKQVLEQLAELQLQNAKFSISFEEKNAGSKGLDDITFMISMNPGEPLKPLQKVASGGELSRLMLGLKTIFTTLQGVSLVVFDEIDTGVSGAVALSIGKKMHDIASSSQVFAVTHLAQVAAHADYHYSVRKTQSENSTVTSIHPLLDNERLDELAAMASGKVTDVSFKAAKELFERVQSNEKIQYDV